MKFVDRWLSKAKNYIAGMDFSQGAMRYILLYAALLMLCCLLYLLAWLCRWYVEGKPDLKELLNFLHEIAGSSWIAVIGFVAKALVDKDHNGIPDDFEREDDKHDEPRARERDCEGPRRDWR
ncbi:MAG: hypothetical protein K6F62_01580 [Schwartzia sp.]|nr:hypothetical protein [Schwartzia sp. (in: firmicutes)]